MSSSFETATFAGGCFWCIEAAFLDVPGVLKVTSGYTGGNLPNPSYEDIHTKNTGHVEAVELVFDPSIISYKQLLDIYWLQINPTDAGGQFADRGEQYKTVVFYHTDEQQKLAEASKRALEQSKKYKKPIVTKILPATTFYPAEEYHREYAKKNPIRYQLYKVGSGRADFLESVNAS